MTEANKSAVSIDTFSDFSIGSMLLRMGKISAADAEKIMTLHKERGIRFGEAAKSLGYITESDIQQVLARQFDYPYLQPGETPGLSPELVAAFQPFSAQVEVLRNIRSQLTLQWFSQQRKTLAFSSISPKEGVSYLLSNLAVVFSQLGQNTLLIDANLRDARQDDIFKLGNGLGLSDVLAGRADVNAVTVNIATFPNLSVLPAGTTPPNPQELVGRPAFKQLVQAVSEKFDVVLIDAPAYSKGADVFSVAASAGGLVLVTRKNLTLLSEVTTFTDRLNANGIQVAGTVLVDF
ncbi:chain length determinant protein tyrosine kinase EpsG [Methylobacillus gramineus]|uniref:chain length determinant protein tyrosine kinase EpsG n=1 Tax=Methylobacillus gramineus TaxID=755169 RepID=UPI001CFF7828|nr:chain length determinant protein tyrosine kinase EpsG [Methylobacillus gramineus]MCB5183686.1 chain length determinant protein tyrosine kinase EpsG [Methylobacillus gramineus]